MVIPGAVSLGVTIVRNTLPVGTATLLGLAFLTNSEASFAAFRSNTICGKHQAGINTKLGNVDGMERGRFLQKSFMFWG